eukprot:scaffold150275_cov21-Tisochrysis_lutea.AAC.1
MGVTIGTVGRGGGLSNQAHLACFSREGRVVPSGNTVVVLIVSSVPSSVAAVVAPSSVAPSTWNLPGQYTAITFKTREIKRSPKQKSPEEARGLLEV